MENCNAHTFQLINMVGALTNKKGEMKHFSWITDTSVSPGIYLSTLSGKVETTLVSSAPK